MVVHISKCIRASSMKPSKIEALYSLSKRSFSFLTTTLWESHTTFSSISKQCKWRSISTQNCGMCRLLSSRNLFMSSLIHSLIEATSLRFLISPPRSLSLIRMKLSSFSFLHWSNALLIFFFPSSLFSMSSSSA